MMRRKITKEHAVRNWLIVIFKKVLLEGISRGVFSKEHADEFLGEIPR